MENDLLAKIHESGLVHDEVGAAYPVNSQISPALSSALYRTVLKHKPRLVVEVGMAYGIASLSILTALREVGEEGRLISIDPNQNTDWKGVGVANVRRIGMEHRHRLIEEADFTALPALLKEGNQIDFAYIDGWHTFDYVLLDFFFLDKMLRRGSVVGFNDCGYSAIHKVLKWLRTHRKYREQNVGLKPDYRARNIVLSGVRRLLKRTNNDRYFQKIEDFEPVWNFYAHF